MLRWSVSAARGKWVFLNPTKSDEWTTNIEPGGGGGGDGGEGRVILLMGVILSETGIQKDADSLI